MKPERNKSLREVFLQAAEIEDLRAREAYLVDACAGDVSFRERVERLLAADSEAGVPPKASASTSIYDGDITGAHIGPYKLLQQIGEGGCGVVYMAEQEKPVRRKVALKVIKLGMDTKQVVARFEAERQALAMMDHPCIAKVLDAGTTDVGKSDIRNPKSEIPAGRPYFVMELVRGVKITDYCDEHQLSTRQRLDLFVRVCHAVQHAHQKGILHRDLKPSNVLVTEVDGKPLPKVIDFGIAKAIEGRLTDNTLFTAFEQLVGTPSYMSPEQASLASADIDTRTDIYSLGVMLYQLLTGETPFDTKALLAAGLDEMRRTIREVAPVRPSTRLPRERSTRHPLDSAQSAIRNPRSTIDRDLDWIVMKCLEKERGRRYETANGLAMDVQRHLNNEPVIARPPSRLYEFQKTVRRHKVGFAATAAVILVLASGLAGVLWQWRRATANERVALQNAYAADIRLAQQSVEEGDLGNALSLLNKYRPARSSNSRWQRSAEHLRGWEWRYLWGLCQSDEQSTLCRYRTWVGGVMVSSNGNVLAIQKGDGQVALWDLPGRREITNLPASGYRGTIAFSPGDLRLAAANFGPPGESEVRLWNLEDLEDGTRLPHEAPVVALTFSPDGTLLATEDSRESVRVWKIESKQVVARFDATNRSWTSDRWPAGGVLQFSPDGNQLAFQSGFSSIRVVNFRAGTDTLMFAPPSEEPTENPLAGQVTTLAFSPSGRWLAWGLGSGPIHLWNLLEGQSAGVLPGHSDAVVSLLFTPDGERLVSGSGDQTIRIWNVTSLSELHCLRGNEDEVWGLDFLPDGKTLVSGGKDGSVRFWDITMPQSATPHRVLPVIFPRFTQDGRQFIALGSPDETIGLWDARSLERVGTLTEFGTNVYCYGVSPDWKWLAVTRRDESSVRIWDWATRRMITRLALPSRPFGVYFSPEGGSLTAAYNLPEPHRTVGQAVALKVWKAGSWEEVPLPWMDGHKVQAADLSPDDRLTAIAFEADGITLRSSPDGRVIRTLTRHFSDFLDIQFSPDGEMLAAANADNFVKVWEVRSGRELMTLRSHATRPLRLAFTPDCRRLAVGVVGGGDPDPRVKLWDLATQRELLTLEGAGWRVAFSPDSTTLAAREMGSGVWKTHFWRAPSWEEIQAVEESRPSR